MANSVAESITVGSDVAAVMYNVTCSTAAATAAKTATASNKFALIDGVRVRVTFTNGNTASNPTLSINSGTAVYLMLDTATNVSTFTAGTTLDLIYLSGSYIISCGGVFNQLKSDLTTITSGTSGITFNTTNCSDLGDTAVNKCGKTVILNITVKSLSSTVGANVRLFTLPVGFRPPANISQVIPISSTMNITVSVAWTGDVAYYANESINQWPIRTNFVFFMS